MRPWSLEWPCGERCATEKARSGVKQTNDPTRAIETPFRLRAPCRICGWSKGTIALVNGQVIARCNYGHYCYAVPRSDLSRERIAELERNAPQQISLWSDK